MGGNFLVSIIKLFIAVLLIPFISSMSLSFYKQIQTYPVFYENSILIGAVVFLFLFIFLYQFWRIYETGQKGISGLFKFAAPFDSFMSLVLPLYLIITIAVFYLTKHFLNDNNYDYIFMFLIGFFAAMHIILASQELQEKEDSPIKPTYYLAILFVIFFVILILVFGIDLVRGKWTFPSFYNETLKISKQMYSVFFNKVLLLK